MVIACHHDSLARSHREIQRLALVQEQIAPISRRPPARVPAWEMVIACHQTRLRDHTGDPEACRGAEQIAEIERERDTD